MKVCSFSTQPWLGRGLVSLGEFPSWLACSMIQLLSPGSLVQGSLGDRLCPPGDTSGWAHPDPPQPALKAAKSGVRARQLLRDISDPVQDVSHLLCKWGDIVYLKIWSARRHSESRSIQTNQGWFCGWCCFQIRKTVKSFGIRCACQKAIKKTTGLKS